VPIDPGYFFVLDSAPFSAIKDPGAGYGLIESHLLGCEFAGIVETAGTLLGAPAPYGILAGASDPFDSSTADRKIVRLQKLRRCRGAEGDEASSCSCICRGCTGPVRLANGRCCWRASKATSVAFDKREAALRLAHRRIERRASKKQSKTQPETWEYAKYVAVFTTDLSTDDFGVILNKAPSRCPT
jgi:hypothetical protein